MMTAKLFDSAELRATPNARSIVAFHQEMIDSLLLVIATAGILVVTVLLDRQARR
jgi:hypothetical protein